MMPPMMMAIPRPPDLLENADFENVAKHDDATVRQSLEDVLAQDMMLRRCDVEPFRKEAAEMLKGIEASHVRVLLLLVTTGKRPLEVLENYHRRKPEPEPDDSTNTTAAGSSEWKIVDDD